MRTRTSSFDGAATGSAEALEEAAGADRRSRRPRAPAGAAVPAVATEGRVGCRRLAPSEDSARALGAGEVVREQAPLREWCGAYGAAIRSCTWGVGGPSVNSAPNSAQSTS